MTAPRKGSGPKEDATCDVCGALAQLVPRRWRRKNSKSVPLCYTCAEGLLTHINVLDPFANRYVRGVGPDKENQG